MKNKNHKIGFDNDKYIKLQSKAIDERIEMFGGKLYLEFGGKIFDDLHASRVLPGFDPGVKMKMFRELRDRAEIIFCINANDIEKKKVRADHGVSYDVELLRLVDSLGEIGLPTVGVVITQYAEQPGAVRFKKQLENRGMRVYCHTFTKGYPEDVDMIVSEEGYGAQEYIETTKPLVIVAAPGAKSGKLATCLAQLYHENKRGIRAGYAKFETFPVWNLPLRHPVNVAYEASTADIGDVNMVDSFHLEKYGKMAINYNRDIAVFPVLRNILGKILGEELYSSPTDMGVNKIRDCIVDDEVVVQASKDEVIRRYLDGLCEYKDGMIGMEVVERLKMLMGELNISVEDRKVVGAALRAKERKGANIVAIELATGEIITGKETEMMTASSAAVINAIKHLGGVDDAVHLILPENLEPIRKIKGEVYGESRLDLHDCLIAMAMGEASSGVVRKAMDQLGELKGLEAHSTVMLPKVDMESLKKLGVRVTRTDEFA